MQAAEESKVEIISTEDIEERTRIWRRGPACARRIRPAGELNNLYSDKFCSRLYKLVVLYTSMQFITTLKSPQSLILLGGRIQLVFIGSCRRNGPLFLFRVERSIHSSAAKSSSATDSVIQFFHLNGICHAHLF